MDTFPQSVCKYCFAEMRAISVQKVAGHNRRLVCGKCGNNWDTVTVILDQKRREYVQVRLMSQNSKLEFCRRIRSCKNAACSYAHNQLELDFWKNQKMFSEPPQIANSPFYPIPTPHNSHPHPRSEAMPPNNIYPSVHDILPPPHPLSTYPTPPELAFNPPPPGHYPNQGPHYAPAPPRATYSPIHRQPQPPFNMNFQRPHPGQPPFYPTPHNQVPPGHIMLQRFQPPNTHQSVVGPIRKSSSPLEKSEYDAYYESMIRSSDIETTDSNKNSFFVHPISKQPLEVKIELSKCPDMLEWIFLVSSNSEDLEVAMGVVLETNYGNNFRICRGLYKDNLMTEYKPINTIPERRSTVLMLKKAINNTCSLNIPIQFKVALGDFKARLIFDFSHQRIVKRFHILVHREHYELKSSQEVQTRFEKYVKEQKRVSLLWDKDYEVKLFEHPYLKSDYTETFTSMIPVNIDVMISEEKYKNVFNEELTHKNYKRIFEMLLYLEEFECRNIFLSYDLKDHPINKKVVVRHFEKYDKGKGGVEYAPKGLGFIKLEMSASLFEGFHFLRPPNIALLKPKASRNFVYNCPSVEQGHDYIWIAVSDELVEECEKYGGTADIRFKEKSIDFHFSMMHQALQNLDPRIIFPSCRTKTNPFQINIKPTFWEKSNLTASQRRVITAALDNGSHNVPTVISGPFGCGKTWTLANLAYLLGSQSDKTRVLVCCKNNAPANKYIEDIHSLSQKHGYSFDVANDSGLKLLYRLFTPIYRVMGSNSEIARRYATLTKDYYGIIPEQEKDLEVCSVIVTTVFTCPFLLRMGLSREFFTHIILDEAAQISEPELGIALSLAGTFTKIIIAGDEYQVTPKLTSPISQKFGLELSLLERLSAHPMYQERPYSSSLIYLKENYRSDPVIVHLLSKLYYSRSLVGMRPQQEVFHDGIKPLTFHGVIGKEEKIHGSPSYMNSMEAEEIVHIIQKLNKDFPLRDFGVISTYLGQIWLIRERLRLSGLGAVEVLNFEGIQGREYKVLIVDTVRTLSETEYTTADPLSMGLLEEPKQLNTILGRAKDHVIVVGNPYTLCEIGKNKHAWQAYISECINLGSFYIGDEQTFQFKSISSEMALSNQDSPVADANGDLNSDVNHLPNNPDSVKQRVLSLIAEREKSLQELISLSQRIPETRIDVDKHFEKEKELILKMKPSVSSEIKPANEQNDLINLDQNDNW